MGQRLHKQHLPSQKVAYHGAWYQSVIPELYLTVTWGTMDKQQMVIKDLYGVREDKSFFIEKILLKIGINFRP
ncbi:hypothetical protein Q2T41_07170 [Maribacter confluentis]|uniref:Uncharacterized protein n=1 Tax=Maribacter confluentis TaxID=1656093 RepID=A0ABT8RNN3_9FLAO|nr:hypothetical protein [Maribacter confluentis]MDO1512430.1 hypothetical protein [Maribacter confluentis]